MTPRPPAPAGTGLPRLGIIQAPAFPASHVIDLARRAEDAGLDELWCIEDCFSTAGVSLCAAALTSTERLHVGLGIMPAVARNPAIAAMEIATLCALAPGRFTPGIGHGVQSWMEQMGARPSSPLTTLEETLHVVRRLLAGEEVTFTGRTVSLDAVRLDQPPPTAPPVLAGVERPRSLALAGRVADGLVLAEGAGPTYVRWALGQAGRTADDFVVTTFTMLSIAETRRDAYEPLAGMIAEMVTAARPALTVLPFWDDLSRRVERSGAAALFDMPADHWLEIGAIGTRDDAAAHLGALAEAGVHTATVFPGPDLAVAHDQIATLAALRHP